MTGKKKELCTLNPNKKWGGKREKGGFKSKWKNSPTKLIRVPVCLTEKILAFAHELDDNTVNKDKLLPKNRP